MSSPRDQRSVAHILERAGVKGGSYWNLLLDCGHETTAHFHRELGQGFTPVRSAPRKMKCIFGCAQAATLPKLCHLVALREQYNG